MCRDVKAEIEEPAILPTVIIGSDAAMINEDDYYSLHPEEDPVYRSDEMQENPVSSEGYIVPTLLGAPDYSYVRILLSTGGSAIDLTLNGCYSLRDAAGNTCALPALGSVYRLTASGNTVSVSFQNTVIASGTQLTLKEHLPFYGTSGNYFSLYNSKYGENLMYHGDLTVYAQSGVLRCVNRVYIEEYLCGVIGNEIGDYSPAEAIKAQAVAARSYAVKSISPSKNYDMDDTSSSQVYKGICSGDIHSKEAVAATSKQVLIKNGSIITGLYSSSNGGEKDTSRNRWGGDPAWSGEKVAEDYSDLIYSINYAAERNSNSYYEQALFPVNGAKNAATTSLITHSLLPRLVARGDCSSATPASAITLNGISMNPIAASKTDAVTYLSKLRVRYTGSVNGRSFDITDDIDYTSFYVANGWGLFSNGNLNQYWLGINADRTYYVLRHARRGHAIGLSQIGARQRALDGKSSSEILSFYYDGAAPAISQYIGSKVLTARGLEPPKGDVNLDDIIDVQDVLLLCRYIAGLSTLSSQQLDNADVNSDGKAGLADAVMICRFIAGLS